MDMRVLPLLVLGGTLLYLLWKVVRAVVLEPWAIRRVFEKQGVKCLPYHVVLGNLREVSRLVEAARASPLPLEPHWIGARLLPHYYHWKKTYGDLFVFWLGYRAVLPIRNIELVKEILSNKFGHFQKLSMRPEARNLVGESVASLEGEQWAQHRRIVGSAFVAEKLKGMTSTMISCIFKMLDNWESEVGSLGCKEIDVHQQFKVLTADIIAHTAFGSSYEEGKLVFKLQQEQQLLLSKLARSIYIPGSRYLPTAHNRYACRLNSQIEATISQIITSRGSSYVGNDLLGILMAANRKELQGSQKNLSLSMREIVDECKTFFFAGHETTATLLTWTTMLLASNPEWQEKTREEVLLVCGREAPTHQSLHNLKIVGMVLHEALRLYPPGVILLRQASKEIKLGSITVPRKTILLMLLIDIHCDPQLWGPDALIFNPQRFAGGISTACKTPLAFFPFSMGPRICLGQNFALLEARAILAMMLQRFRFSLSPGYKHSPVSVITVQPQHGMQIIFEKLE
ncbi:hypothetical protein GOP47_0027326 [Adiantum capillus-veneris]|nr:hypothetical protein GOP47_0027326 [Adiantum capillus-veneris]